MASLYSVVNRRLAGFAAGSSSHLAILGALDQGCIGHGHLVYVFLTRPGGMVGYSRCLTSA